MGEKRFVSFFKPSFDMAEEEAVSRVLKSGWLTTGEETLAFEKEFAAFVGVRYALACNSASSGLILAMDAVGVRPGKKILTSPYTFISTATSAMHLGADVEYVDIESSSYNIDINLVEERLKQDESKKEIVAIVPIHIAGNVCNMKELITLAKKYSVAIVEDAAHAFPIKTPCGYAGTIGNVGVFSFYATKTMTTGEGGMVCTNDEKLARRIATMRSHGMDRSAWDRYTSKKASYLYDIISEGWKFNMPDILSCIGRAQLRKADSFFESRKQIAQRYNEAFASCDVLQTPPNDEKNNAWHLYLLRLRLDMLKMSRDEVFTTLQERGLGLSVHFIPHFEFSFIKEKYNIDRTYFPESYKKFSETISLPFYPYMKDDDVEYVIQNVLDVVKENRR